METDSEKKECLIERYQAPRYEIPEAEAWGNFTRIPKRWISEKELIIYTGLSRSSARKLGEQIGCVRRFGRRVLYDRFAIDQYFDSQK